jgi:enoyl-CoA hydratase/carnithine racemase
MSVSTDGDVRVQREPGHVACVILDRPAARNAITPKMAQALEAAADELEQDPLIRVVVLTGAGAQAFSAGADLATVAAGRDQELLRPRGGYLGLASYPRRKPWIAAVRGVAAGGGLELALSCDMIVAGVTAHLGLPETRRGTLAGACGVYRLPQRVPQAIALEWLLTGDLVPAHTRSAWSIIWSMTSRCWPRRCHWRRASPPIRRRLFVKAWRWRGLPHASMTRRRRP